MTKKKIQRKTLSVDESMYLVADGEVTITLNGKKLKLILSELDLKPKSSQDN